MTHKLKWLENSRIAPTPINAISKQNALLIFQNEKAMWVNENKEITTTDDDIKTKRPCADGVHYITYNENKITVLKNDETLREFTLPFLIDSAEPSPKDPDRIMYTAKGMESAQYLWWASLDGTRGGAFGMHAPNSTKTQAYWSTNGLRVYFLGKTADKKQTLGHMSADGADLRQWICDTSLQSYATTSSGDIVCITDEETPRLGFMRIEGNGRRIDTSNVKVYSEITLPKTTHPARIILSLDEQSVYFTLGNDIGKISFEELRGL